MESVDRNWPDGVMHWILIVALRKESVDRNVVRHSCPGTAGQVALRKESVDRNRIALAFYNKLGAVALRKESVDRNWLDFICASRCVWSRSPQGERG